MKNKLQKGFLLIFISLSLFKFNNAVAQCSWKTLAADGFEYTTACPDVIPGTVYTSVPQTWIAHSGSRALYLNFVNCSGGTGTCAGDTVYRRTFTICPNSLVRLSAWFVTTFAGPTSDMRLLIVDGNNNVLNDLSSLPCPNLTWVQYQSPAISPTTSTFSFVMITNVDGGNGNDLSVDDMLVENCVQNLNIGSDTSLCNTQTVTLDAGIGFTSYLWNTGSTNQSIIASTTWSGSINLTYSVLVSDSNGCNYTDTIKISFLDCSGINSIGNQNQFAIYPNPASDYITISADKKYNNAYFILMDAEGRELDRIKIENKKQDIQLHELANGVYFYRIADGKSLRDFGKINVSGHSF